MFDDEEDRYIGRCEAYYRRTLESLYFAPYDEQMDEEEYEEFLEWTRKEGFTNAVLPVDEEPSSVANDATCLSASAKKNVPNAQMDLTPF